MADIYSALISPLVELVRWGLKKLQKPDPVQVLKRREELRREFELKLPAHDKYGVHCEAIISDIRRMDSYPEVDTKKKRNITMV